MKISQGKRTKNGAWVLENEAKLKKPLVLVFADRFILESNNVYDELRALFPDGELVFGSTSGEIMNTSVTEETLSLIHI